MPSMRPRPVDSGNTPGQDRLGTSTAFSGRLPVAISLVGSERLPTNFGLIIMKTQSDSHRFILFSVQISRRGSYLTSTRMQNLTPQPIETLINPRTSYRAGALHKPLSMRGQFVQSQRLRHLRGFHCIGEILQ